ncbi:hypothetical protein EMPG_16683 [Blastomyces silverae]|uniref:Uncharacterized protein n=1 Tax=Blastomyces silverae TaxID=2060906 RepID=A0A0H1BA30_9EURO|nr:hypothetical protein EMPG_16683 [Blastomyces silverae]
MELAPKLNLSPVDIVKTPPPGRLQKQEISQSPLYHVLVSVSYSVASGMKIPAAASSLSPCIWENCSPIQHSLRLPPPVASYVRPCKADSSQCRTRACTGSYGRFWREVANRLDLVDRRPDRGHCETEAGFVIRQRPKASRVAMSEK